MMNWPPIYTVKTHPRARRVKLKASVKKGLEVIVPPRFNHNRIPDVLEEHKTWILKHTFNIQQQLDKITHQELPNEIYFAASDRKFNLVYIPSNNKKMQLIFRPHQELVILGDVHNKTLIKKLLTQWVKEQSSIFLTELINKISKVIGLDFSEVSFRCQATRWGSCNSKKNISLNYKLIFLPYALASHIIIHELCHTVHMNHSQKFWKKVASFDPQWKENTRAVRKADSYVPHWFD